MMPIVRKFSKYDTQKPDGTCNQYNNICLCVSKRTNESKHKKKLFSLFDCTYILMIISLCYDVEIRIFISNLTQFSFN